MVIKNAVVIIIENKMVPIINHMISGLVQIKNSEKNERIAKNKINFEIKKETSIYISL